MHIVCMYVGNAQMAVVSNEEGPASSVTSGDDVVSVETLFNGTVNAIKLELELLPAVGEVKSYTITIVNNHCCFFVIFCD